MDEFLDQFAEDQINGGYGHILDQLAAEDCDCEPPYPNCDEDDCEYSDHCDDTPLDGDHDSTMTSIGWGSDEDYGYFGDDGEW